MKDRFPIQITPIFKGQFAKMGKVFGIQSPVFFQGCLDVCFYFVYYILFHFQGDFPVFVEKAG
jgi:hypothetical protein